MKRRQCVHEDDWNCCLQQETAQKGSTHVQRLTGELWRIPLDLILDISTSVLNVFMCCIPTLKWTKLGPLFAVSLVVVELFLVEGQLSNEWCVVVVVKMIHLCMRIQI